MADLRDPQSYNLWDKERWSKSARMKTAESADENAFKREADLRKGLQELVNSGALARLTKGAELAEAAADKGVDREFKTEERSFTRDLARKGRAFGLLPRVLSGEDISPEDSAILAENAPGFANLNRARSAIGGSPMALGFGRQLMERDVADVEAGTGEAKVRGATARGAMPFAEAEARMRGISNLSKANLFDVENEMNRKNIEADRARKVSLEKAQIEALKALAKQREAKTPEDPRAALGGVVPKIQPPARIQSGLWQNPAVAPGH